MAAPDPYRVVWQPSVRESVRDHARLARARRLMVSFASDLEQLETRLRTDPAEWGDPLNDLPALKLVLHRGHSVFLFVYFAVNGEQRTVLVRSVEPHPYGPIA